MLKNAVIMICWTVLAIIFNKWWLALFAALMMTYIKDNGKTYFRTCNKCGKHGPYAKSEDEANHRALDAGWWIRTIDGKWDDRCPDCQEDN